MSAAPWTRSTSAAASSATHAFKVVGGRLHRGLGAGRYVRSAPFAAGGHRWRIRYYPDGSGEEFCRDYAAVFLELMGTNAEATVLYDFRLVNQATGVSTSVFSGHDELSCKRRPSSGAREFVKKRDLQALGYLKDDLLVIECDVTVVSAAGEIKVPPSDLLQNIGKLMESEEGVDVTFRVGEVVFRAHRIVLAMRSPVFKAELYGLTGDDDGERQSIVVEDMEPPVFKALLRFFYTDSLPAMDDVKDGSEYQEMVKNLLVAADRYGMEGMKLMCESILCKRLSVMGVADILVLANQLRCCKLKDACIRFIAKSSNRMDGVIASQGYENLKRSCPALTAELWEKSAKSYKRWCSGHPG